MHITQLKCTLHKWAGLLLTDHRAQAVIDALNTKTNKKIVPILIKFYTVFVIKIIVNVYDLFKTNMV